MSDAETRHPCYISKESLVPFFLEPAEHDLDPVAALVASLIVFDRLLALFLAGDAGSNALVLQRFPEPVGIVAAITEKPFEVRQAAEQSPCADIFADLSCGDEQVDRPPLAVADGVQLIVHAAFGSTDQATAHPF